MSAADRKKELRRRQKALRATAAARRAELRRRLLATPAFQRRARRRRLRQLLTAVALLLLVLACCDRCGREAPAAKKSAPPPPPPVEASRRPDAGASKPVRAALVAPKLEPTRRGRYELDETRAPTWLERFRMQVSSRSLKLASCFQGAERPGALRWSAALTPESGLVGDQLFERLGPGDDVSPAQRECLSRVLASPPYQLGGRTADGGAPPSTPTRVGLVLEF